MNQGILNCGVALRDLHCGAKVARFRCPEGLAPEG
jgi:hypothetical protein